jgi:biotin-[acetyl-CoA-carboxylase] ligase BirA-like protein
MNFIISQRFIGFTKRSISKMNAQLHSVSNGPCSIKTLKGTQFFQYNEVTSTQDCAKKIVSYTSGLQEIDSKEIPLDDVFAVIASLQNAGRGSRGRNWTGVTGNLFMTIAMKLNTIPCPLTLIPLRVGTLVSPHIRSQIAPGGPNTYLKWPNDILIGNEKVSGTLIEIENDWVFIGIGCNVEHAPMMPIDGPDAGRPATCIALHKNKTIQIPSITNNEKDPDSNSNSNQSNALILATAIASDLRSWASGGKNSDLAENIVSNFTYEMNNNSYQKLRSGDYMNKNVLPIRVNIDGTLQVRLENTDEETTLIADYLW